MNSDHVDAQVTSQKRHVSQDNLGLRICLAPRVCSYNRLGRKCSQNEARFVNPRCLSRAPGPYRVHESTRQSQSSTWPWGSLHIRLGYQHSCVQDTCIIYVSGAKCSRIRCSSYGASTSVSGYKDAKRPPMHTQTSIRDMPQENRIKGE